MTRGLDFEQSVRAYWQLTPETPTALADRFVAHVLRAPERSREWLASLDAEGASAPDGAWLDLGCGTADLAAAAPGRELVGCDIALRWLVIARKRPEFAGGGARLICCGAERLPFADGSFARVLSLGLLEHTAEPASVLREAARVLAANGRLDLRTVNRFSLLHEPHVRVWGVGFLPRRWADGYVRRRSGQRYLHHRPLSRGELRRTVRAAGFRDSRVGAARLLPAEAAAAGGVVSRYAALYEWMRRAPLLRTALASVAPLLEATGRR
jgi:SAM-dependent methyltransferase